MQKGGRFLWFRIASRGHNKERMKKVLVLGGTQFIGRNLVERLLAGGSYEVTLFNRQKTGSDLFPQLNKIKGDRETDDMAQIAGVEWDYVLDLSCYFPAELELTLQYLPKGLTRYIFVSTCSVYPTDPEHSGAVTEQEAILPCSAEERIDRSPSTYGNRKAECERVLENSAVPYAILRPGLVYGRYDHTDRFYYWLFQVRYPFGT